MACVPFLPCFVVLCIHTFHVFSNCIMLVGVNLFYFYNTYSYSNPGLTRHQRIFVAYMLMHTVVLLLLLLLLLPGSIIFVYNRIYLPSFFAFAITALVSFPGRFLSPSLSLALFRHVYFWCTCVQMCVCVCLNLMPSSFSISLAFFSPYNLENNGNNHGNNKNQNALDYKCERAYMSVPAYARMYST